MLQKAQAAVAVVLARARPMDFWSDLSISLELSNLPDLSNVSSDAELSCRAEEQTVAAQQEHHEADMRAELLGQDRHVRLVLYMRCAPSENSQKNQLFPQSLIAV
jgi:hypothetical protein